MREEKQFKGAIVKESGSEQKTKEKNISVRIAKELGYSQATVSRVIRHCSSVDSDTRRQILSRLAPGELSRESGCDIYVILPDTPGFFWKDVRKGTLAVKANPSFSIKHNIYTNVRDEDTILHYLAEAEVLRARVIVIAAILTPAIREKLEQLRKNSVIFLLSEGEELVNTFYFGADSYRDGALMGSLFCERYADMVPIIVNVENNHNVKMRLEGFSDALCRFDRERFQDTPLSMITIHHTTASDPKLFPSKIASLLAEVMNDNTSYCLYVPFGNASLSRILQKTKCGGRLICIGHDCMIGVDGRPEYGIAATIRQNTRKQGEAAMCAALRYMETGILPKEKYTYIPSELCVTE